MHTNIIKNKGGGGTTLLCKKSHIRYTDTPRSKMWNSPECRVDTVTHLGKIKV